jgi:hypothetical protein
MRALGPKFKHIVDHLATAMAVEPQAVTTRFVRDRLVAEQSILNHNKSSFSLANQQKTTLSSVDAMVAKGGRHSSNPHATARTQSASPRTPTIHRIVLAKEVLWQARHTLKLEMLKSRLRSLKIHFIQQT